MIWNKLQLASHFLYSITFKPECFSPISQATPLLNCLTAFLNRVLPTSRVAFCHLNLCISPVWVENCFSIPSISIVKFFPFITFSNIFKLKFSVSLNEKCTSKGKSSEFKPSEFYCWSLGLLSSFDIHTREFMAFACGKVLFVRHFKQTTKQLQKSQRDIGCFVLVLSYGEIVSFLTYFLIIVREFFSFLSFER